VVRSLVTPVTVETADDTVDLLEVLRTGAVRGSFRQSLVRGSSWITKLCGWRSVLLDWTLQMSVSDSDEMGTR
jgi:hypothetical protein